MSHISLASLTSEQSVQWFSNRMKIPVGEFSILNKKILDDLIHHQDTETAIRLRHEPGKDLVLMY